MLIKKRWKSISGLICVESMETMVWKIQIPKGNHHAIFIKYKNNFEKVIIHTNHYRKVR